MDEFDKAEERAEKRREKMQRYAPLVENPYGFKPDDMTGLAQLTGPTTLHLPKVKTPAKRTNEIAITIYVDGQEIHLTARLNLNDIIASQRTQRGFIDLFKAMLLTKFGRVEIT